MTNGATSIEIGHRRVSPSLVNLVDICSFRIPFYLDRERQDENGILRIMGTSYHAGLETHYRNEASRQSGDSMAPRSVWMAASDAFAEEIESAGSRINWTFQAANYRQDEVKISREEAWAYVDEALTRYFEEGHAWDDRFLVQAVEMRFELPLAGMPEWERSGYIDLVLLDPETSDIIGIDHKLSRKKWRKGKDGASQSVQAALYMSALAETFGKGLDQVKFHFDVLTMQDRTFTRFDATRTPLQVYLSVEKAKMVAKLIEQGGPYIPNTASPLCSHNWCDYWAECPFGRALKG